MKSLRRHGIVVAAEASFQILERSLEIAFVGQHRECGRTGLLQFGGEVSHVEVGADQSFGRRGFFQLGDDRRAGARDPLQVSAEAPRSMTRRSGRQARCESAVELRGRHPFASRGDDFFQLGRHGWEKYNC